MRVIKKGTLPNTKTIKMTCGKCGQVMEFQRGELHYVSDQRDGDFYTIPCPLCNAQITIQGTLL